MSYRREPRVSDDTWVLVADRAKATFFHANWPTLNQLKEVERFDNPEGAAHRDEVLTDRPGRFAGPGPVRQSGEPRTDFRHRTAKDFAIEIIDKLEEGRTRNKFGRLVVVAPALMLGVLREHISGPLEKTIVLELNKELVDADLKEIVEQVQEGLTEKAGATNGHP